MKKFFSLLCAISIIFAFSCFKGYSMEPVKSNKNLESDVIFSGTFWSSDKTEEEILCEFESRIEDQIDELGLSETTRMSEWYREDAEPQTYNFTAFPSGQPTNGYRFNSNYGGFVYTSSGGATQTLSLSFGDPFGIVSLTVDMGTASPSEGSVGSIVFRDNLDPNGYYKLRVLKQYLVKPYIIYTREYEYADWVAHHYKEVELTNIEYFVTRVS